MDNIDILVNCGFTKPVIRVELKHKHQMIKSIALQKVIFVSLLAELSQFREGLYKVNKMRLYLTEHPALLELTPGI